MDDSRTNRSTHDGPGRSTDEVLAVLDRELSWSDRLRYLAVGLAGLVVAAISASLWATEPALPLRTRLAFAGIVLLGVAWMALAAYVLTRRRPLYGTDRVLATGLAVVATSLVGIATTVIAGIRGGVLPGLIAGAVTTAFVVTSAVLHLAARRRRDALLARRRELVRRHNLGQQP
ncbi:MAG: transmembrane transport protein [Acidimicrobiia bacterium]